MSRIHEPNMLLLLLKMLRTGRPTRVHKIGRISLLPRTSDPSIQCFLWVNHLKSAFSFFSCLLPSSARTLMAPLSFPLNSSMSISLLPYDQEAAATQSCEISFLHAWDLKWDIILCLCVLPLSLRSVEELHQVYQGMVKSTVSSPPPSSPTGQAECRPGLPLATTEEVDVHHRPLSSIE